ncbi:hypothetical protein BH18ACT5_BH18ACT5_01440 [soil metagenome]
MRPSALAASKIRAFYEIEVDGEHRVAPHRPGGDATAGQVESDVPPVECCVALVEQVSATVAPSLAAHDPLVPARAGRAGDGGRSQRRANCVTLARVVPEPFLAGLVTLNDRMPGSSRVVAGVLRRRRVATADMAALGTATKVEPPTAGCEALDTTRAARRYCGIDKDLVRSVNHHVPIASSLASWRCGFDELALAPTMKTGAYQ